MRKKMPGHNADQPKSTQQRMHPRQVRTHGNIISLIYRSLIWWPAVFCPLLFGDMRPVARRSLACREAEA